MMRPFRKSNRDRGKVAVFFALMAPVWLAFLGLLAVGGGRIRAYQHAYYVAAEAARAGGQAIQYGPAIDGGAKRIDEARAVTAAQAYLAAAGATGTVKIDPVSQTITVTATIVYKHPVGLPVLGEKTWHVTGTATAHPLVVV
jgi:Flp pilus assembly protein TadG